MFPAHDLRRTAGLPGLVFKRREQKLLLPRNVLFQASLEFSETLDRSRPIRWFERVVLAEQFIQPVVISGIVFCNAGVVHRRNLEIEE